ATEEPAHAPGIDVCGRSGSSVTGRSADTWRAAARGDHPSSLCGWECIADGSATGGRGYEAIVTGELESNHRRSGIRDCWGRPSLCLALAFARTTSRSGNIAILCRGGEP